MSWDPGALRALVAVVEGGTFEEAASRLHVTPSAVSQRIRGLERAVGQVVVTRARPCTPTDVGETLLRHARQLILLEAETARSLRGRGGEWTELPVVVNADSLATWFREVLDEVASWDDIALQLHVQDQQFSAEHLRRGAVMAAVTADRRPVQGCTIAPLGSMTYIPCATPRLAERWRTKDGIDLAGMPMVRFNPLDDEQHAILRRMGKRPTGRMHHVPSSADYAAAVRAGLGWGALPTAQLGDDLARGVLVRVSAVDQIVPLFWQRWRIDSPLLDRLSELVTRVAARHLRG